MSRLTKGSLVITSGLVIVSLVLILSLLFTSAGARLVLAQVPGLKIGSVSGTLWRGLDFDDLSYQGGAWSAELDALSIKWQPMAFLADGKIHVEQLYAKQAKLISASSEQTRPTTSQPFSTPVPFTLERLQVKQLVWFTSDAAVMELSHAEATALSVNASELLIGKARISRDDDELAIAGTLDLSLSENGVIDLIIEHSVNELLGLEAPVDGSLSLRGTWSRFDVVQTISTPFSLETLASVEQVLNENLRWQVRSQLNGLTLPNTDEFKLRASVDSEGSLQNSTMVAHGDLYRRAVQLPFRLNAELSGNQLRLSQAELGESQRPLLQMSGLVTELGRDIAAVNVDLQSRWNNLHDLGKVFAVEVPAATGQAQLVGTSQQLELRVTSRASTAAFGDLDLSFLTQGSIDSLSTSRLEITGNQLALLSELQLELQDSGLSVDLTMLTGQLHGQAIAGSGRLRYSTSEAEATDFVVTIGGAKLNVNGRLGGGSKLDWSVAVPKLNFINSSISGDFIASGRVTGSLDEPVIFTNINLSEFGFDGGSVESIVGQAEFGSSTNSPLVSKIVAENLRIAGEPWVSELMVETSGRLAENELRVQAQFDAGVQSVLKGSSGFDGSSINFDLSTESFPAQATGVFTRAQAFDLQGAISLAAKGEYSFAEGLLLDSQLNAPRLTVEPKDANRSTLELSDLALALSSANQETSLSANSDINGSGRFEGLVNIAAPLFSPTFMVASINSELELVYPNLDSFATILPPDIRLSGALVANASITGTVNNIAISTKSDLSKGSFEMLSQGLSLREIDLTLRSDAAQDKISLQGTALAGEGQVDLSGELDLRDSSPKFELNLDANNATLLSTPEIKARADTDLVLSMEENVLTLSGGVTIRQADIKLGLAPGVIAESPDVLFEDAEVYTPSTRFFMDLDLDLGSDTRLSASGLTGRLTGNPRLSIKADGQLTSVGDIQLIGGKFSILGEQLSVDKGVASYVGGDISNPRLSAEVVRNLEGVRAGIMINGNADSPEISLFSQPTYSDQDILALVFFEKPLNQLSSVDAFKLVRIASALSGGQNNSLRFDAIQDSIANYLGVDKLDVSLDTRNGQPSLSLATKINSKLDIGYAYNFVSSLQALFLKYRLSDNWTIQSSVDVESGADIVYGRQR